MLRLLSIHEAVGISISNLAYEIICIHMTLDTFRMSFIVLVVVAIALVLLALIHRLVIVIFIVIIVVKFSPIQCAWVR